MCCRSRKVLPNPMRGVSRCNYNGSNEKSKYGMKCSSQRERCDAARKSKVGRLEAAHRHRRNLGQSGNAMVVVGPLAPTCAGIVGRIASVRANESRTGCWVRLTFTCGRRRLEELGRGMTAARSTMLDNHYLRRTMGQLGRIALHLSRNGRSAPVIPTGVHIVPLVRGHVAFDFHGQKP